MVGVPGKSKGCITCRRRKIKCSEEKPECKKCSSSGRSCEGYGRYPVFISRTAEGLTKRKALEEAKPTRRAIIRKGDLASEASWSVASSTPPVDFIIILPDNQALNMASTFLRTAEAKFLETWLPTTISRDHPRCAWVLTVMSQTTRSRALDASLKALVLTQLGRAMHEESLVHQGRTAYGLALSEVQKALWSEKQMFEDDTLAAGRVCSMYELYEATAGSPAAWGSHESGMVRLVCLRGPERHQDGVAHEVFRGVKLAAMIYSLQQRVPSMLLSAEGDWHTTPWLRQAKDDRQYLYDYGLILGALMIDHEICMNPDEDYRLRQTKILECLPRLYKVGEMLDVWPTLYNVTCPEDNDGSEYGPESPAGDGSFSSMYFTDFDQAEKMSIYWTLQMLQMTGVLMIGSVIPSVFGPGQRTNEHLQDLQLPLIDFPKLYESCLETGRKILLATQYFYRPDNGLMGPQTAIFPLRVALSTWRRMRLPGLDKCQQLYDMLASRWGLLFARTIDNAAADESGAGSYAGRIQQAA